MPLPIRPVPNFYDGPWFLKRIERKFITACELGNLKAVVRLVSPTFFRRGIDVNMFEGYPLRVAAVYGHIDVVSLLIERGAIVNLYYSFEWVSYHATMAGQCRGKTSLMLASMFGHIKIVELLIDAGADVNALANTDSDLKQYSYPNNYLMFGPPKEPCDTALLLASKYQHTDIVNLLKLHGAKSGQWKRDGWL